MRAGRYGPAQAWMEVTSGQNCDESRARYAASADSLLIKPSEWAGSAPATPPRVGQVERKASLRSQLGFESRPLDEATPRSPCQPVPDQPRRHSQLGLLDQIWRQISLGNAVKASRSARARSRCSATVGSFSVRVSMIRSNWACTASASGWS